MTNRIQEHKIIALQAIIFVSLLIVLSFILEGCSLRGSNIDQIEINNPEKGPDFIHQDLLVSIS